jgi:hypothetical protein
VKIESVSIRNIKGIEALDFALGSVNVLSGDNGTGKTSVLDAIRSIFEGGHDPALLRNGTEIGCVSLTLSDGHTIKKTVTDNGSTLSVKSADGSVIPAPKKFVEQLAEGFSYDPLAFLAAKPKDRLAFLLSAMPIYFTPEEVEAQCGVRPAKQLDIDGLAAFRQGIYDARAKVNLQMKNLDGTIVTLKKSLPESTDEEAAVKVDGLKTRQLALVSQKSSAIYGIKEKERKSLADLEAEFRRRSADIIGASEASIASECAAIDAELETVAHDLGAAESVAEQALRAKQIQASIAEFRAQSKALVAEGLKATERIEALDALKRKKLSDLPVAGVEPRDGEIYYNGVALDHVNTQQQVFLAFQLASLRPGQLGFMLCDHAEAIVGENWGEFLAGAEQSGYQVVVARAVAGEPLAIKGAV